MRLAERVAKVIERKQLWAPGDRVAVAVSGGLDSICLLDLLQRSERLHGGSLEVVTVDHGVRLASAADADFVAKMAYSRGLALHRFNLSLASRSEQACRDGRYLSFQGLDVDRIALAHHRDDQVETVLVNLLRGTGLRGLAGMRWQRGRYVRPLLGVRREELVEHARAVRLEWVEDGSNSDLTYLRNRVRQEVVPMLESTRGGATSAIARCASLLSQDADFLDELAREFGVVPDWSREALVSAPEPVSRRAILTAIPGLGAGHVDAILAAARIGRGAILLPGRRRVIVTPDRVYCASPS